MDKSGKQRVRDRGRDKKERDKEGEKGCEFAQRELTGLSPAGNPMIDATWHYVAAALYARAHIVYTPQ